MTSPRKCGLPVILLATLLATGGTGCKGEIPAFTITAPGTGPENVEPLFIPALGTVIGGSVIDSVVATDQGTVFRLAGTDSWQFTLYLQNEQGIFRYGDNDGVLDRPALIIPAKVRLGMKWTVFDVAGAQDLLLEVADHGPTAHQSWGKRWPWGDRGTWKITATNPQDPDELPSEFLYVEGVGPPETVLSFATPTTPAAPVRVPMPMDAISIPNWDATLPSTQDPGMVRIGDGPALLMGGDLCTWFDGEKLLDEQPPMTTGPFATSTGPACVTSADCHVQPTGVDVIDICWMVPSGHPNGVFIAPDGTINWLPRSGNGKVRESTTGYMGQALQRLPNLLALSLVGGGPEGHGRAIHSPHGLGNVVWADEEVFRYHLGDFTAQKVPSTWWMLPRIDRVFALPDRAGPGTSFILVGGGMVWTSRWEGDGYAFGAPKVGGRLTGKFSVLATDRGTEVLRITGDGQVDELTVGPDGLVVTHLADVTIPDGEAPVGAWRWYEPGGARVVVATVSRLIVTYGQHLYRSRSFLPPGTVVPIAPALKLVSGASSDGIPFVCWPPAAEPVDFSSWTMAGAPPLGVAYAPGNACAAVVTEYAEDPPANWNHFAGHLPGLGEVRSFLGGNLVGGIAAWLDDLAPLTGGGFASMYRLYGPGALEVGVPDLMPFDASDGTHAADLRGNGFWYTDRFNKVLRLVGRTSAEFGTPNGRPLRIEFPAAGGGVVVTAGTTWLYVTPDGTWTELATPAEGRLPITRVLDGTLCGRATLEDLGAGWYCQPPSGPETLSIESPTNCTVVIEDGTVVDLCLGLHYLASGDVVPTDPPMVGSIHSVRHASDGSAWASIRPLGAPSDSMEAQLVRVTDKGAHVVQAQSSPSFAVDESVIISTRNRVTCEPRP